MFMISDIFNGNDGERINLLSFIQLFGHSRFRLKKNSLFSLVIIDDIGQEKKMKWSYINTDVYKSTTNTSIDKHGRFID